MVASPDEMTIEELSAAAQVATTTVRMYQAKGMLPGPRRDGRIGRYGPGHLARLRLIGRLQERGFSLAAIQQLVDSWEAGHSLDDVLGVEQSLPGAPETVRVTADELVARFPAGSLSADVVQQARELGLAALAEDGALVVNKTFLEIGTALAELGIPPADLLAEQAILDTTMDDVAGRFVDVFRRHLRPRFPDAGISDAQLRELATLFDQLNLLARRAVDASLHAALRRAAEQAVAEEAPRLVR